MAETPEITPALTPEEWAHKEIEFGDGGWAHIEGVFPVAGGDPIVETDELYVGTYDTDTGTANGGVTVRRHALAALCLDGQPFGFTKEDALLCVGLAKWLVCGGGDAELRAAGIHSFNAAPAEALRRLASRIASLLPPEP